MRANQSNAITNLDSIAKGALDLVFNNGMLPPSPDLLAALMDQYPDDPAVIRFQADKLKKDGKMNSAARMYCKAAELHVAGGRIPAAVALKLMQWRISSPTKAELKKFLINLKETVSENQAVKSFFCRLSLQESAAFYASLDTVSFPPDQTVRNIGDLEDSLCFVISGALKGSQYHTVDDKEKNHRGPNFYLHENDYFGEIYPFDSIKKSTSYIETKSQVELLRISKEKLRRICTKYTRIERGLLTLLKVRSGADLEDPGEKLRDTRRIPLKLSLGIEILLNGSQHTSIYLSGFTKDVSIGGICFILDEMGLSSSSEISSFENILKYAKVQVNFPIEELKVSIPGTIVWLNTVSHEGRKTIALGIQFDKMSPKLKGLLMMFFNSFTKK